MYGRPIRGLNPICPVLLLLFFLSSPFLLIADAPTFALSPVYSIPLNAESGLFTPLSTDAVLTAQIPLSGVPWLLPELGIGYVYAGLKNSYALSTIGVRAGASAHLFPLPWLDLWAAASLQYSLLLLAGSSGMTPGLLPGAGFGAGAVFPLNDSLSLGVAASARYDFGQYLYFEPGLSVSYRPGAAKPAVPGRQEPPVQPAPLSTGTEGAMARVRVDLEEGVFPVFYKYYDDHPFGSVTVSNPGTGWMRDVKVSFYVKKFMDAPRECAAIPSLAPGESRKIDVVALFNDEILSVTEATKVASDIGLEYAVDGRSVKTTQNVTLRVYRRNNMTWSDDRRAAAFVSANDPAIVSAARRMCGDVKAAKNASVNENLQIAAAVHEAFRVFGVNYVRDPTSAISDGKTASQIDYLQFPRETLEARAGDCDDLSVLYCAFLEAVGIETAFLTVPGHIFIAASLNLTPEAAKAGFLGWDDLIFRDDKAWLPIEVTLRDGGFLEAWREGAREWREGTSKDRAGFFPVQQAWAAYEPVALPGTAGFIWPASDLVIGPVKAEVARFVEREIAGRVLKLRAEVQKEEGSARTVNALGALYAKNGLVDRARAEFEKVVAKEEYVPALVNLGNLARLEKKNDSARDYYERAYKVSPGNPNALLALARINQEEENYGAVKKYYAALQAVDPALALRHSYLGIRGEEAAKAAEASGLAAEMAWAE